MEIGEVRQVIGPRAEAVVSLCNRYESGGGLYNNYLRTGYHAPVITEAHGSRLVDVDGNEYLDLTGGFCTAVQGYSPAHIRDAVVRQLDQLWFLPEMPSEARALLAEFLVRISPGDLAQGRVQFEISGAGTVDLALQIAAYFGATKRGDSRVGRVLAFTGAYHGRTTLTGSVGSLPEFRRRLPFHTNVVRMEYPYCYRCPYGRTYPSCGVACGERVADLLKRAGTGGQGFPEWQESDRTGVDVPRTNDPGRIDTLIVEPLQDYAGMIVPPPEFHQILRDACDETGVTFVADEVPCFLHTGRWFGIENWGVVPDVIAIGKELSGGFAPVGAVIAKEEIFDAWGAESGRHFTTYMGYPVGCAGALANLRSVEELGVLGALQDIGSYLKSGLERLQGEHPIVGEVSGLGGLLGMEFVRDRVSKEPAVTERNLFAREALRRGVVIPDAMGDSPRSLFIPPASLTQAEMDVALAVIDECMAIAEAAMPQ